MAEIRVRSVLIGLAATVLSGCASVSPGPGAERFVSPLHRDHPLVGRTWAPAEGRFATEAELGAALRDADYVLFGEKHNNADHHRRQARLVRDMFRLERRPAVAFEMLTADQQAPLDAHLAARPGDAAGLGEAVGWDQRGWPPWPMYQPIVEAALAHDAPLLAGGLARATTRAVASQGADALGAERARRLRLTEPVDDAMQTAMRDAIHESHCGQLPQQMLDPMVTVTLAKDAAMAEAMIRGRALPGRDSAVLIAGTGHVRRDWGVAWHLVRLAPDARIVSIGLVEVVPGEDGPTAYAAAFGGGLPFDFVWFAPRVDDEDPCEVFAEQLRRMRERHAPAGETGDN